MTEALNEGRSLNSGDTPTEGQGQGQGQALNEGRSLNSGDTRSGSGPGFPPHAAQRRPESELRRHRCCRCTDGSSVAALNEGRSLNSGDTAPRYRTISNILLAQRRPESELRRHATCPAAARRAIGPRSTKAGV